MQKLIFSILFVAITKQFCLGQFQNYYSKQLTINEGLSHNTVEHIFKDSEGIMWFATHNGLDRYDGFQITRYRNILGNSNSISGNKILCISEDLDGFLWIGTAGSGVCKFNKKTEIFERFKNTRSNYSLPNNVVNNVKVLSDGTVWVCTNHGIAKYNKEKNNFKRFYPVINGISKGSFLVYDILETKTGNILLGTNDNCLYKLDTASGNFNKITYKRQEPYGGNYRKHLNEDENGNIWISAFAHGLVKLNLETTESEIFTRETCGAKTDLLNGTFTIHDNKLWLTTDGDGLLLYDIKSEKWSELKHNLNADNLIYSNKLYSVFIDNQDIAWIGTFSAGVNILNPNQLKFSKFKDKNLTNISLEGLSVLAIFEDSKENLWIGTDGDGLFKQKKTGEIICYKHEPNNPNSLSSNRIVSLNEDASGNLLIGSFTGGLVVFNPEKGTFKRYWGDSNDHNTIAANHVWSIFRDSEQRIWLGLLGAGLDRFNVKEDIFIHYGSFTDNFNRLNNDNVMAIIEDKDGDIWFGTDGGGINVLDKQSRQMFHSINPSSHIQLSNNNVRCIYEDSYGIIWIGTENGGLNRYDKRLETIEYFYRDHGLPSSIIYSIVEDGNRNLWLGTAYGLAKFDIEKRKFRNYDINDGLLGYVCNRNAIYKKNDGTILLGTTNGLNIFHPDSIKDIDYAPKAIFTNLRINNTLVSIRDSIHGRVVLEKNINYVDKIIIEPKDKTFTLEFAANTYTLPEKCLFKYKLEGFDNEWKTTEASRQYATYSNLNPGSYKFKVKASNSDGVWSTYQAELKIHVMPSFWQSIWFKLVIAFWVLVVFYAWYKYKLNVREKQFLIEQDRQNKRLSILEKEKLEGELNNQTFNILNRNRSLLKHKRRLSLLVNKVDEKTKKTLNEIISEIDHEVNQEKDWKHIEPRLDKVYNNFMTTLKGRHSNLTQSELRIAAYVRMGLSTKEISELLQKTTKAIDNDRYRLRKKLDIPQNDSLKGYLLDL